MEDTPMHRLTIALWATLGLLSAAPAFAARPTVSYLDYTGVSFVATGLCAFDIREDAIGNNEKVATFFDRDQTTKFQIVSGVNKWRFTNLVTGKAVEINGSGPARFYLETGGATVRAESGGVSFFYIPNPPTGIPSFALTKGRVVAELDPLTFTILSLTVLKGTVQDICQLLQ